MISLDYLIQACFRYFVLYLPNLVTLLVLKLGKYSFQSLYELEFVNSTWQWSDGKLSYSTRNASETWVQQKWSASVVQLDPNTWILEYRRTGAVENSRIVSAVLEFLKFRLSREVKRLKQEFWLFPAFGNQYDDFTRDSFKVPT